MSIFKFSELHSGRKKKRHIEDGIVVDEYERKFLVLSDDKADGTDVVENFGGAPSLGSLHPDNARAAMISPRIQPAFGEDAPKAWHATYEYSTKWPIINPIEDPLLMPDEVDWTTREITVPLIRDAITGTLILNSAGDPPDPPITTRRGLRTAHVLKRLDAVPSWFLDYTFVTNSDSITFDGLNLAPKQALITIVSRSQRKQLNSIGYYQIDLDVEVSPTDQLLRVLNDGFNQLAFGNSTDKRPIMWNGEPTQIPVPLAVDGSVIPPNTLPGAAVFREWNEFPALPFTALGLPV